MSEVRVQSFCISLDGYGAGPDQSRENPLGRGGEALHEWVVPTRTFARMRDLDVGTTGIDDDFAAQGFANNRRLDPGPQHVRSGARPWPDDTWKGWWGDEPP